MDFEWLEIVAAHLRWRFAYFRPWLTWWALPLCLCAGLSHFILIRRLRAAARENSRRRARADAAERTAERAIDDLHAQLDSDERRARILKRHTVEMLSFIGDWLDNPFPRAANPKLLKSFRDLRQRLRCLQLIESHIEFAFNFMEMNFHAFIEDLFASLCPLPASLALEIVPVNDATRSRIPGNIAIPAALICNELVLNSARHAFAGATGIHSLGVHLAEKAALDGYVLEVADSGCGLPAGIDPAAPATPGLHTVARLAQRLGADMQVCRRHGTRFTFHIKK